MGTQPLAACARVTRLQPSSLNASVGCTRSARLIQTGEQADARHESYVDHETDGVAELGPDRRMGR